MKGLATLLLIVASLLFFALPLFAAVPSLINYQGIVTDTGGSPVTGTHDLTFRIYPDSLSATTPLWTEVHPGVDVDEGLFNIILGGTTPITPDLFDAEERWMGITVDSDQEMYPRMKITSVPWALRASVADSALVVSNGGAGDGHSLDAADGYPVDVVFVDEDGKVGVGTTNPSAKLHTRVVGGEAAGYFLINNTFNDSPALYGVTNGSSSGVKGEHTSGNYGYLGSTSYGAYGEHSNGNRGYLGSSITGVYGRYHDTNTQGYLAYSDHGVYGVHDSGNEGYVGGSSFGVYGRHNSSGNTGSLGGLIVGAYGRHHTSGNQGELGRSDCGVYGEHAGSGNAGYIGGDSVAVYGSSDSDYGVYGYSNGSAGIRGVSVSGSGVSGVNSTSNDQGSLGNTFTGVYGRTGTDTHIGVFGFNAGSNNSGYLGSLIAGAYGFSETGYAIHAETISGLAGYFEGDVEITGNLTKGSGSFLIDHPLDPENKLLRHNFVESPENLLIYRGMAALDSTGEAVVEMPGYFESLAKEDEATVTLTSVGRPFLTGYEWLSDHSSFKLYGEPHREVSWVVYADRDDPVIHQLARPVEEEKGPQSATCDKGELLYPKAYGFPQDKGRDYKNRKAMREFMFEPTCEIARK